jgi:hypothetical protein
VQNGVLHCGIWRDTPKRGIPKLAIKNESFGETVLDNPVSMRRDGNVAIVTIDNPPVNALRHGVRKGLLDYFTQARDDASVYDADAEEGCHGSARVICVDWNSVELEDLADLVIAPMADTEMAKKIGIPVDDQDKEERGESSFPNDANIDACEDVDGQLMKDAADDVDDARDDELVSVYDK